MKDDKTPDTPEDSTEKSVKDRVVALEEFSHVLDGVPEEVKPEFLEKLDLYSSQWQNIIDIIKTTLEDPAAREEFINRLEKRHGQK